MNINFQNNVLFQAKIPTKNLTVKQTDKVLRNNLILDYTEKGVSPFKIAKIFDISYDTVHRVLNKMGYKKIAVKVRQKNILELLMQGFSRKEVAKKVGVSIYTVHNVAHENKTYRAFKKIRDADIMKLLEQEVLCRDIAKKWNISEDTVWRINKARKKNL